MKVFVWKSISEATDNWHSGGGLIVFAEDENRARELARLAGAKPTEEEKPDETREVADGPEACYIMPDAGCC